MIEPTSPSERGTRTGAMLAALLQIAEGVSNLPRKLGDILRDAASQGQRGGPPARFPSGSAVPGSAAPTSAPPLPGKPDRFSATTRLLSASGSTLGIPGLGQLAQRMRSIKELIDAFEGFQKAWSSAPKFSPSFRSPTLPAKAWTNPARSLPSLPATSGPRHQPRPARKIPPPPPLTPPQPALPPRPQPSPRPPLAPVASPAALPPPPPLKHPTYVDLNDPRAFEIDIETGEPILPGKLPPLTAASSAPPSLAPTGRSSPSLPGTAASLPRPYALPGTTSLPTLIGGQGASSGDGKSSRVEEIMEDLAEAVGALTKEIAAQKQAGTGQGLASLGASGESRGSSAASVASAAHELGAQVAGRHSSGEGSGKKGGGSLEVIEKLISAARIGVTVAEAIA